MKKSILTLAILFSIFTVVLNSCSKDDKDDKDEEQDLKVSSLKFTMDGITVTEVVGEIMACPDGYFGIVANAPDGTPVAINTSKILVGETRSICTIMEEADDFSACVDNGGFNVGGTAFTNQYSPISGTAKRTSVNDITISGVFIKIDDLTEHAFTLEATASLISPVNCE
jgi:hypothetical protein